MIHSHNNILPFSRESSGEGALFGETHAETGSRKSSKILQKPSDTFQPVFTLVAIPRVKISCWQVYMHHTEFVRTSHDGGERAKGSCNLEDLNVIRSINLLYSKYAVLPKSAHEITCLVFSPKNLYQSDIYLDASFVELSDLTRKTQYTQGRTSSVCCVCSNPVRLSTGV